MIEAIACLFMWAHGFLTAWAFAHEDQPLWSAYLDVATLRILWRKP
jgi:hypothetical protein